MSQNCDYDSQVAKRCLEHQIGEIDAITAIFCDEAKVRNIQTFAVIEEACQNDTNNINLQELHPIELEFSIKVYFILSSTYQYYQLYIKCNITCLFLCLIFTRIQILYTQTYIDEQ